MAMMHVWPQHAQTEHTDTPSKQVHTRNGTPRRISKSDTVNYPKNITKCRDQIPHTSNHDPYDAWINARSKALGGTHRQSFTSCTFKD